MATKEEISMVGFEIVAYAGDAQTDLLAALDAAREGDFEKAEQLHKEASDALIRPALPSMPTSASPSSRPSSPNESAQSSPLPKALPLPATGLFRPHPSCGEIGTE